MHAQQIPFVNIPLQIANLKPEIDKALDNVLARGSFIQGYEVAAFEKEWATFCRVPHAIGVGSGTDALITILRALGIGRGDEVITVANSFIATATAISFTGATPVLVDCNIDDFLINIEAVGAAITPRTKAIIPVHLYGQPANVDALSAIASRRGIALIEDSAQAHGATLRDGRMCGSLGDAAAFSFYPAKNLGALGDGGAVTTGNDILARKIRLLSNLGSSVKYHHEIKGLNSRLDTVQACVLSLKLQHLKDWNEARRVAANWYREALSKCVGVKLPLEASWTGLHSYHLFVIRILEKDRDSVARVLAERGVQTVVHYPIPIHLQKAYSDLSLMEGAFPATELAARTILSLPMYPEITRDQVHYVADALKAAIEG